MVRETTVVAMRRDDHYALYRHLNPDSPRGGAEVIDVCPEPLLRLIPPPAKR